VPLKDPGGVFGAIASVSDWHSNEPGRYELAVADIAQAAPQVARGLVGAERTSSRLVRTSTHSRTSISHWSTKIAGVSSYEEFQLRTILGGGEKEMRDYRRKRSIVVTMVILPFLFLIEPVVAISSCLLLQW